MIITIARECGCHGNLIGEKLSEKYSIPLYNKSKILELAKKDGLCQHFPNFLSEKDAGSFLTAIAAEGEEEVLRKTPGRVLTSIVGEKSGVLIGRCGNWVYHKNPDTVCVFLSGEKEQRISHIMEKHDVSHRKAEAIVEETDQRRSAFQRYYTGEIWGYAGNYDLCLDVSQTGIEGAVTLIDQYLKMKMQRS
ncbi:MAG: cytidylate kinase-like family protein [Lachnospiraceae bacterium]|nr:cytidylate kinase-like family protein [Lachnospiraceae bacterium]